MFLFFLYSSDSRSLFFSAVPLQEMTPLPRNYLTRNSFSLSQNGKNNIKKRTSAEERPFCFAILFSIHMMIHTSPPLLSFTIFFIVS